MRESQQLKVKYRIGNKKKKDGRLGGSRVAIVLSIPVGGLPLVPARRQRGDKTEGFGGDESDAPLPRKKPFSSRRSCLKRKEEQIEKIKELGARGHEKKM